MTGADVTKKREARGFTLMEVLVALALFSVIITVATNLFLSFQRTSRKTESLEQLTGSARFIVERIAREVREGTVDYEEYATRNVDLQVSHPTTLFLRTSANQQRSFALDNGTITMNDEELTGSGVRVQDVQFTIVPAQDPFEFHETTGKFLANAQPRVTILLTLDNNKPESDRDYTKYDVQTTISSRVYRR